MDRRTIRRRVTRAVFCKKFGVVTSAVGITLAFAEAGEALDSKLHDAYTRQVRKPRFVMAAMTAILEVVA